MQKAATLQGLGKRLRCHRRRLLRSTASFAARRTAQRGPLPCLRSGLVPARLAAALAGCLIDLRGRSIGCTWRNAAPSGQLHAVLTLP